MAVEHRGPTVNGGSTIACAAADAEGLSSAEPHTLCLSQQEHRVGRAVHTAVYQSLLLVSSPQAVAKAPPPPQPGALSPNGIDADRPTSTRVAGGSVGVGPMMPHPKPPAQEHRVDPALRLAVYHSLLRASSPPAAANAPPLPQSGTPLVPTHASGSIEQPRFGPVPLRVPHGPATAREPLDGTRGDAVTLEPVIAPLHHGGGSGAGYVTMDTGSNCNASNDTNVSVSRPSTHTTAAVAVSAPRGEPPGLGAVRSTRRSGCPRYNDGKSYRAFYKRFRARDRRQYRKRVLVYDKIVGCVGGSSYRRVVAAPERVPRPTREFFPQAVPPRAVTLADAIREICDEHPLVSPAQIDLAVQSALSSGPDGRGSKMPTKVTPATQGTLNNHGLPLLAPYMSDPEYTIRGAATGFRTGYDGPPRSRYTDNHASAYEQREAFAQHIALGLQSGHLIRVTPLYLARPDMNIIVNPAAAIVERADKVRVVINGSFGRGTSANGPVNPHEHPRIHLATPDGVADDIQRMEERYPGEHIVMQVFDLKDAYKSCPIDPRDWWQLAIAWEGEIYWYIVAVNGHRTAGVPLCTISTAIARAVTAAGYPTRAYVDDLSVVSRAVDADAAEAAFDAYNGLAGTVKSVEKRLKAGPAGTVKKYIGFIFDIERSEIRIPDDKLQEIRDQLDAMITAGTVSRKAIDELAGLLQWAVGAAPRLRPFVTPLRLLAQRRKGPGPIPRPIMRDLIFLRDILAEYNGRSMLPTTLAPPTATIYTDASRSGWGYCIEGMNAHAFGTWAAAQDEIHINVLEAVVAVAAVRTAIDAGHRYIHVYTDNSVTQAALTRGSTQSPHVWAALRAYARSVTLSGAHVTVHHLQGVKNVEADGLSRGTEEPLLRRWPASQRCPAHPSWDTLLADLRPTS